MPDLSPNFFGWGWVFVYLGVQKKNNWCQLNPNFLKLGLGFSPTKIDVPTEEKTLVPTYSNRSSLEDLASCEMSGWKASCELDPCCFLWCILPTAVRTEQLFVRAKVFSVLNH